MTNEMKVLTVKEAIEYAIDNGIKQAEKQLISFEKNGRIRGNQIISLERSLLQLHETVEITGGGKRGKVYLGRKHNEIQERIDGNKNNGGKPSLKQRKLYQQQGAKCDLFDRLEKDRDFRHKLHDYFQTRRISRQMFYAYYFGFEEVYFENWNNYLRLSRQEINKRKKKVQENFASKYVVYRFISNEKVLYVGLSSDFKRRIYQHKYAGHLKQEWYNSVDRIEYIELETEVDMNIAEIYFIAKFKPAWNSSRTYDGKLGITIEDLDNLEWKTLDFSLKNII